ncbi:helix-turn-helix domain-containing protein [Cutibacterium acnes]|uniref:XRE family transcriptional regulator n=1 Tax=Cutibacterium acnes TaxID=1747 RepID=UPI00093BC557|nr:XRE family transcriptional regulator [Cutibacterium acnes]
MWPRSLLVGRDAASQQSDIAESMTQIARSVRVGRESRYTSPSATGNIFSDDRRVRAR